MIAVSKNNIITDEPYYIAPYKLNIYVYNEETQESEITLINYSQKTFENICLAVPYSPIEYKFENSGIEYKERTMITVKTHDELVGKKVFAYSGNQKLTPDFIIT